MTYKEWVQKHLDKGVDQESLDAAWLSALRNKRSGHRLDLIDKITSTRIDGEYSNVIAVSYNGSNKSESVRFLDVKDENDGTFTLFLESGAYTFKEGAVTSNSTSKGTYITVPAMINTTNYPRTVYDETATKILGSKKSSTKKANRSKFNRIENTVHGNVEKMQELLEEIHVLGGSKESREHVDYLKGLIGQMNPKFLKQVKTYIDTNAKESGGVMASDGIEISISKADKLAGNQQSEAEIYAHEVVHSYVTFAVDAAKAGNREAYKLYREIEYLVGLARKHIKVEDLMPEVSIDKEVELENAKAMYEYIFNSEHAEEEFISHILTNPLVMKKAKEIAIKEEKGKSLWQKVKDLFETLINVAAGNFDFSDRKKNVYEATRDLTFRLAEYNIKTIREAKAKESLLDRATEQLNGVDGALADKMEEFYEKYMPKGVVGPKPEDATGKAKWYAEALGKMALNPVYRSQLSKWATAYGLPPEGSIQTMMRDFFEQDDLSKAVDWISLASDRVDGMKMNLISAVKDSIVSGFKEPLDKVSRKALTRVVMDTDLESIYNAKDKQGKRKYSHADIRKILSDEAELDRRISRVKNSLKELDEKRYFWHVNQAVGLGWYLATGEAHIAQNMNAMNIARGLLSEEYKSPNKELVQLIDEVATLTALKYTKEEDKKKVAELMKADWRGVLNVVSIAKDLKDDARKSVFSEGTTHIIKGYTKEVFDDRITMEIALTSEKADMEKRGFKLVKVLEKHPGDTTSGEFGMYVSDMFSTSEWYRTATRLTKMGSKGTGLKELMYASEDDYAGLKHKTAKTKLDTERVKAVSKMLKGEIDIKEMPHGLVPILNEDGAVVDYRYMMNKEDKEKLLGMSTDIAEVAGRTKAHIFDKFESEKHNKKLLDIIEADAKENYINGFTIGKNDKEYVVIKDKSTDPKIQELWNMLPKSFKTAAMNNSYKGIAVRRDLLNNYFGYRHVSFADFPGLKLITPQIIKNVIRVAETLWAEFIKISKVDILIKMPFVIVGNILSNFMYAVMTGTNPVELVRMYMDSTRDVRSYLKKHRELVELRVARDSGNIAKKDIGKIAQLERELANNPIHELYELGVYQAIVEDISKDEFTSTNKLKQWYKDKTEKVPQILKDGANWVYLTEETQYYKFMSEVLQMSDLVARDVENRKLKVINDNQKTGKKKLPKWFLDEFPGEVRRKLTGKELKAFEDKAKAMRLDTVLNAFVNYNKPSGAIEEYLNRMGLVMFTKYAKRIQRVIGTTAWRYPIKSMAVLLGQEFLLDVETIQDQSIFTRSWYNMGLSEGDLIPGKPLWEYFMEVFTPPILQSSTYRLI